ncbi:ATP-dependent DNA helicase RecG [bacterium]|nr:ATP-dependent DNA helicase RecG [bacterium]
MVDLKKLSGVGPKVYTKLKEKGIENINSLLYTFPSDYIVYKLTGFLDSAKMNAKAIIIDEFKIRKLSKNTKISFEVLIDDIKYRASAFNMLYLDKVFHIGSEVVIIGEYNKDFKEIQVSKIISFKDYKEGIFPDYNIDGIANKNLSKIIAEAISMIDDDFIDSSIPKDYFQKYNYKFGKELFNLIHFPKNEADIETAKNTLKYLELLSFFIKLEIRKQKQLKQRKTPKIYDNESLKSFISLGIHFELTQDQKNAVNDICRYLSSNIPMNMLLEGDVGCGKTIVSIIASYAVYLTNYQTLVMVPTEALAFQHYATFKAFLEPFSVRVSLLTSSAKNKDRKEILVSLKNGDIDIIIGTHSLLNDEVEFKNLGFVVCDEQHKFGVEQRNKIIRKGDNPDVLYMTATPIPRTLALTIFNNLTLKTIKTSPKTRKKIKTFIHTYKDYLKVLDFVKEEINDGRQAYFVAPLIDEEVESSVVSVNKMRDDLVKYYGDSMRIGLLHGKLSQEEKNQVLKDFMDGKINILASTTVIEVGIDNPNASVMVIIDANRFGLSTLHQLRGRVGRGSFDGYSFLMVENKEYIDRLRILEETQDGFLISEQDLKDRGPGDFLGTEQSGMIKFRYANIFFDTKILNSAKEDAKALIKLPKIIEAYESDKLTDNFN